MKWTLLFLGGGTGAVMRALLSGWISERAGHGFPLGTLTVNVLGCLAIGAALEWMALRGAIAPQTRALVVTGFLGGFTTFSTFGHETVDLLTRGEAGFAMLNVGASVALGTLGVVLGAGLVRSLG